MPPGATASTASRITSAFPGQTKTRSNPCPPESVLRPPPAPRGRRRSRRRRRCPARARGARPTRSAPAIPTRPRRPGEPQRELTGRSEADAEEATARPRTSPRRKAFTTVASGSVKLASSSETHPGILVACRARGCPPGSGRARPCRPGSRREERHSGSGRTRPPRSSGTSKHGAWWCGHHAVARREVRHSLADLAISPAISWPRTLPAFLRTYQSSRSEPQIPETRVRTSASPGPISGSGILDHGDASRGVHAHGLQARLSSVAVASLRLPRREAPPLPSRRLLAPRCENIRRWRGQLHSSLL